MSGLQNCRTCGGYYDTSPDGRRAHVVVFGHLPDRSAGDTQATVTATVVDEIGEQPGGHSAEPE